jgi:protein ImuA
LSPNRNGDPFAVPDGASLSRLEGLRTRIAALEQRSPQHLSAPSKGWGQTVLQSQSQAAQSRAAQSRLAWTLGTSHIDRRLESGLNAAALHEVKPEEDDAAPLATRWAAALGFALRLAVRRLRMLAPAEPRFILWCWPAALAREIGMPNAAGLSALGVDPSACLFVETARASEALWAMEEGLRSAGVALVIGALREAELTPARRLSLAAAQGTPCLLVTDPRSCAAASTATRWRVGARASAPDVFEPSAPGAPRYSVTLERCREGMGAPQAKPLVLEWAHETHSFRVAAAVADRTAAPRCAKRRAGGGLPRAG